MSTVLVSVSVPMLRWFSNFLLMLEFVKVFPDVDVSGKRELRDKFHVVGLHAGVCVFLDIVSIGV